MDASLSCNNCGTRFHEDCAVGFEPDQPFMCEMCRIDGGFMTVDKILAIKFLTFP